MTHSVDLVVSDQLLLPEVHHVRNNVIADFLPKKNLDHPMENLILRDDFKNEILNHPNAITCEKTGDSVKNNKENNPDPAKNANINGSKDDAVLNFQRWENEEGIRKQGVSDCKHMSNVYTDFDASFNQTSFTNSITNVDFESVEYELLSPPAEERTEIALSDIIEFERDLYKCSSQRESTRHSVNKSNTSFKFESLAYGLYSPSTEDKIKAMMASFRNDSAPTAPTFLDIFEPNETKSKSVIKDYNFTSEKNKTVDVKSDFKKSSDSMFISQKESPVCIVKKELNCHRNNITVGEVPQLETDIKCEFRFNSFDEASSIDSNRDELEHIFSKQNSGAEIVVPGELSCMTSSLHDAKFTIKERKSIPVDDKCFLKTVAKETNPQSSEILDLIDSKYDEPCPDSDVYLKQEYEIEDEELSRSSSNKEKSLMDSLIGIVCQTVYEVPGVEIREVNLPVETPSMFNESGEFESNLQLEDALQELNQSEKCELTLEPILLQQLTDVPKIEEAMIAKAISTTASNESGDSKSNLQLEDALQQLNHSEKCELTLETITLEQQLIGNPKVEKAVIVSAISITDKVEDSATNKKLMKLMKNMTSTPVPDIQNDIVLTEAATLVSPIEVESVENESKKKTMNKRRIKSLQSNIKVPNLRSSTLSKRVSISTTKMTAAKQLPSVVQKSVYRSTRTPQLSIESSKTVTNPEVQIMRKSKICNGNTAKIVPHKVCAAMSKLDTSMVPSSKQLTTVKKVLPGPSSKNKLFSAGKKSAVKTLTVSHSAPKKAVCTDLNSK